MDHLHQDYQIVQATPPTSGNAARVGDWINLRNAIDLYVVSSFRRPTAGGCKVELECAKTYAGGTPTTITEGRTVWSCTDTASKNYMAIRTSSSASYTLPSATGTGVVITHLNPSVLSASKPYVRVTHGTLGTANDGVSAMYYLRSRYSQERPIIATTSST
jgi:hypothetical protein